MCRGRWRLRVRATGLTGSNPTFIAYRTSFAAGMWELYLSGTTLYFGWYIGWLTGVSWANVYAANVEQTYVVTARRRPVHALPQRLNLVRAK